MSKKSHNVAVSIVPPDDCVDVWERISRIRCELRDPNFFRWPPHINLLYPFIEPINGSDVIERLSTACQLCQPFDIHIQTFGTFGGKNRGVLWLDPTALDLDFLQTSIGTKFPQCTDKNKPFRAHLTVSHFESLSEAAQAARIAQTFLPEDGLSFRVDHVCLLQRVGDDGQFMRVAELQLGSSSVALHATSPKRFPLMPEREPEWTHEERMKLKARRKGNTRRR